MAKYIAPEKHRPSDDLTLAGAQTAEERAPAPKVYEPNWSDIKIGAEFEVVAPYFRKSKVVKKKGDRCIVASHVTQKDSEPLEWREVWGMKEMGEFEFNRTILRRSERDSLSPPGEDEKRVIFLAVFEDSRPDYHKEHSPLIGSVVMVRVLEPEPEPEPAVA